MQKSSRYLHDPFIGKICIHQLGVHKSLAIARHGPSELWTVYGDLSDRSLSAQKNGV